MTKTTNSPAFISKTVRISATLVLLLLLGAAVLAAVGNLVGMLGLAASLGTSVPPLGWFWLLLAVVLPIIAGALAWYAGIKKPRAKLLFLLFAVAMVAVLQIEMLYFLPRGLFLEAL